MGHNLLFSGNAHVSVLNEPVSIQTTICYTPNKYLTLSIYTTVLALMSTCMLPVLLANLIKSIPQVQNTKNQTNV